MRQTSLHSAAETGCTESREFFVSTMLSSIGFALAAASVTGFGSAGSRSSARRLVASSMFARRSERSTWTTPNPAPLEPPTEHHIVLPLIGSMLLDPGNERSIFGPPHSYGIKNTIDRSVTAVLVVDVN